MLRAGMIRKLASGLYTWSPLGLRVLRKVERIVREEMERAGSMEILLPAVQAARAAAVTRASSSGLASATTLRLSPIRASSRASASGNVSSQHLNKHIDYDKFSTSERQRDRSLSMPVGIEVSADGKTTYIAAKGSDRIASRSLSAQFPPWLSERASFPWPSAIR